ncbi:aspartate aminotransferase family protein [Bacteroidota bacterium]
MLTNKEIFKRHLGLPSRTPLGVEIVSAEGVRLYGKDGEIFFDLVSGVAVSNIGHRHPAVIKAIRDQADKYLHLMVYGEIIQSPQVQYAKALCDNLPVNLNSVYFVNSGSEAIEGALKLSKRYTGRAKIVSFKNAYHGGTAGALSILGNEELKNAFRPLPTGIIQLDFNDENQLEQIDEKVACVVVECIQAEAGIIFPENDFLKKLRKRCDKTGALLIVDDIQMGFGRTGKLFSFEHFGIVPDILCLAKAMGGGLPLGAFISSKEIMDALTVNPALGHITTFGGHPLCCAAGLASLEVILDQKLAEKANEKGQKYVDALKDHPGIKEIRQKGLMLAVELKNKDLMPKLHRSFVENGLLIDSFLFDSKAFRIAPPLTINESDILTTIDQLKKSLDEINLL